MAPGLGLAVVTGGGSGIGRAAAQALNRVRQALVVVGRDEAKLDDTLASLDTDAPAFAVAGDVADPQVQAEVAGLVDDMTLGRLSALVHAAGVLPVGRLRDMPRATWQTAFATNVEARLTLTQALLPQLRAGAGRVLFVGSMSASTPRFGGAAYSATMAASAMLCRCLQQELGEEGVPVASFRPGTVDTALLRSSMASPEVFRDAKGYAEDIAAGRLVRPEAVGEFVRFLLTETSTEEFVGESWVVGEPAPWLPAGQSVYYPPGDASDTIQ